MRTSRRQLELPIRTWGGCRRGAGRKRQPGRGSVAHRVRSRHDTRCPVHVTLRATRGLPSFRMCSVFAAMRSALAASSTVRFRVVHFSVQRDHVHLLVEADAHAALVKGMQGLTIRVAKAVNRVLRRHGTVWSERYHSRLLGTPREVRNALIYVLNNWLKHLPGARGFDPCSSATWFADWSRETALPQPIPVARPRTWLAAVGWRRAGRISVDETPRLLRPVVQSNGP